MTFKFKSTVKTIDETNFDKLMWVWYLLYVPNWSWNQQICLRSWVDFWNEAKIYVWIINYDVPISQEYYLENLGFYCSRELKNPISGIDIII